MFLLNTTMLREKFTVTEKGVTEPMVATGNRINLPLIGKNGRTQERLVVRGHNMHTTLRMAAMICKAFMRDGPLLARSTSFAWGPEWMYTLPDYEKQTNPKQWIAVYSSGRCIFKQGDYHPFMDVIEQCDARNRDEYDRAVKIAEDAFNLAQRDVHIEQQSTIAMVIGAMPEKTRVGLIFRNPRHSSTFNFGVEAKPKGLTSVPHECLLHAANWLELVQLSVTAGFHRARRGAMISEASVYEAVQRRLGRLNTDLTQFEEKYEVSYRPDRPGMIDLIDEAASFARGEYAKQE